uniref:Uncharacterized protein n=1 Tax=Triticum aestivum TaxID=4565 RepID=A0A3B6LUL4_WHEAT
MRHQELDQSQQHEQSGGAERPGARSPVATRRRGGGGDLYGEAAGGGGGVGLRGDGERLEVARLVLLVLHLEVHVEGVGGVAVHVHAVAAGAHAERRAVGEGAGVVHVLHQLALVLGVGVVHAPRLGQVLHALGRHQHGVLPVPGEVHGELGLAVEAEHAPVPLERARRHALDVLVQEPEEVDLHVLFGPERRAGVGRQPRQQAVVEALGEGVGGVLVAVGRPADLADDDGQVAVADGGERRHQRVEVGVEHVGVSVDAVDQRLGEAVEEGEVDGEVLAEVEAEVGVDVDGEGGAVVGQELHHLRHERGDVRPEAARRRHLVVGGRVVDVGVERHGGLDLAESGVVERVLDVLQRREGDLVEGAVVGGQKGLIADGHVPANRTEHHIISK